MEPSDIVDLVDEEVAEPSDSTDVDGYAGPERRKANLARIAWEAKMHEENSTRFQNLEGRIGNLESGIGDVLAILQGAKQGIRFGIAVSHFARWLLPILGLIGMAWGYLHGGNKAP